MTKVAPIPGFEGRYSATEDGRIISHENYSRKGDRYLTLHARRDGYVRAVLCVEGKARTFYVHRLVALAFLPNPKGMPQVNHRNAFKGDNSVKNLEWCSDSANKRHAIQIGVRRFDSPRFIESVRRNVLRAHSVNRAQFQKRKSV